MTSPATRCVFQKGALLCYRFFDIADEIDLERARQLVTTLPQTQARRLRLGREGSQYLELPEPPLTIELGNSELKLREHTVPIETALRLYNFGAAAVLLRVAIPAGTTVEALIPLADELYDSRAVTDTCLELAKSVSKAIAPALEDAHLWEQFESYTIIFAEALEGAPSAAEVLRDAPLAKLLLGELQPLSERERTEVIQHSFSYTQQDLAVIDWNAAFVYEPSASSDVPDILEMVNAQLLELRWFDAQLDRELATIYDEINAKPRRSWRRLFRSPYRALARRVLAAVLEMSEFVERVENALKIIGDFYLAKVYEASLRRLRINAWQQDVQRKQQLLDHVYDLLKSEIDTQRSLTLEATIVVLIVVEMALAVIQVLK